MSIAITITLSLLCIFIGTVVLHNAEKIHELLKCKGCPCKKESWCCKEQPWTDYQCFDTNTLIKSDMRIIPNEWVKDVKVTFKKIKIQNSKDTTNTIKDHKRISRVYQ